MSYYNRYPYSYNSFSTFNRYPSSFDDYQTRDITNIHNNTFVDAEAMKLEMQEQKKDLIFLKNNPQIEKDLEKNAKNSINKFGNIASFMAAGSGFIFGSTIAIISKIAIEASKHSEHFFDEVKPQKTSPLINAGLIAIPFISSAVVYAVTKTMSGDLQGIAIQAQKNLQARNDRINFEVTTGKDIKLPD
ncbi:MAG: hypothetical protein WCK67_09560 [bacterium]